VSLFLKAYGAAGTVAAPWLRRMLRRRARRAKEIAARLSERYGQTALPRPDGTLIWLHAASVGETMSVLPVIDALRPHAEVLLTTGTVTSSVLAARHPAPHLRHQFVPLDVPLWVSRFLAHWRPDAAVFVESEIWPGMLAALDAARIPRLLINARMSAGSAANWRRVPKLARRLLGRFAHVHAQSSADAARLAALGVEGIKSWGNLKFFTRLLPVDEAALAEARRAMPGPLWLAASTHPGEELILQAVHQRLLAGIPGLITVIVPRHPHRGGEIAAALRAPRRSLGEAPVPGLPYIADTLGELGLFYRLAPFAFVGGSLVDTGGHNIIEPVQLGRPVIVGPHMQNFAGPVDLLRAAGGLAQVSDEASLAACVLAWLNDPEAARKAGAAGAAAVASPDDLPGRIAALIMESIA